MVSTANKPSPTRSKGGPSTHKEHCLCNACKRKTEALVGRDGVEKLAREARAQLELIQQEKVIRVHTGSTRDKMVTYAKLQAEGYSKKDIADRMGIAVRTLTTYIRQASKEGWLKIEDPVERFHTEIVPNVVDNIAHFIKIKDKQMTIEAAKGAGIFKSHQAMKVETDAPQTILALKIEMPPGATELPKITGIVGKPRALEGFVVEDDK